MLDASALLAVLLDEPGGDLVNEKLDDCEIHAVNFAEVARKLYSKMPAAEVDKILLGLNLDVITELTVGQAFWIGQLIAANPKVGLSFGDAACLTTAALNRQTAITADRRWTSVSWTAIEELKKIPEVMYIRKAGVSLGLMTP